MCGFLSNFQLTYAIVHNQDKMNYLMNLYIGEAASHEYAYDRKVSLPFNAISNNMISCCYLASLLSL